MPTVHMLIGVPGVGKSTWTKNFLEGLTFDGKNTYVIVSSDNIIQKYADDNGITYTEALKKMGSDAMKQMMREAKAAIKEKKNIIWDQTNLTCNSRKQKLNLFTSDYEKIDVIFKTPDHEEHQRRLNRPGKFIPEKLLEGMKKSYQAPVKWEGFHRQIEV